MVRAYIASERIDLGDPVFIEDGMARRWRPKDGPLDQIELDPKLKDRVILIQNPSPKDEEE